MSERALVEVGTTIGKTSGLVRQAHGGALSPGNPGSNAGGRPRDKVRRKLVNLFKGRGLPALTQILNAARTVDHTCSSCGQVDRVTPPKSDDVMLKALDMAGKYGLGTYKEVEEHRTVTLIAPPPLA